MGAAPSFLCSITGEKAGDSFSCLFVISEKAPVLQLVSDIPCFLSAVSVSCLDGSVDMQKNKEEFRLSAFSSSQNPLPPSLMRPGEARSEGVPSLEGCRVTITIVPFPWADTPSAFCSPPPIGGQGVAKAKKLYKADIYDIWTTG